MEGLKIPKSYITKGLYVYCNKCKKIVTDKNGQPTKKNACKHFEEQVFKSVIYPQGAITAKTKVLPTREVNEARKLHIEFEEIIKKGKIEPDGIFNIKHEKPKSVKGCIGLYFTFQRQTADNLVLSQHQKQVEKYVLYFAKFLKSEGLNLDTLGINDIEPKYIKLFRNHLDKKYASATINRYLTLLKGFYNHLIYVEGYQIINPFHKERRKPVFYRPKSFPINQIEPFLETISSNGGVKTYTEKVKKTLYRTYLKEVFLLSLYTGRRREGLVEMKFSEITPDKYGKPSFITTNDIKFNKRFKLNQEIKRKLFSLYP